MSTTLIFEAHGTTFDNEAHPVGESADSPVIGLERRGAVALGRAAIAGDGRTVQGRPFRRRLHLGPLARLIQ